MKTKNFLTRKFTVLGFSYSLNASHQRARALNRTHWKQPRHIIRDMLPVLRCMRLLARPTKEGKVRGILEVPSRQRQDEFLSAVARSRALHRHWASPPRTREAFEAYLKRITQPAYVGYWVRTPANELAGVININEIVRGTFCSGYLGYYAFVPYAGRGYMTEGLRAVISEAFRKLRLHRLEANIQPDNEASRRLVQRLGFRQEGFSLRYLKVAGCWCDHERWALTTEEWTPRSKVAS